MNIIHFLAVFSIVLPPVASCTGRNSSNAARRQVMIDKISEVVLSNYVFPERADSVADMLQSNLRAGKYGYFTTMDEFIDSLNLDLQAAANDKHLMVIHSPRLAAQLKEDTEGDEEVTTEYLKMLQDENFRLRKVESMDGNIGYFRFDNFVELRFVESAFTGAMNFLNSASAMILDLRENGGGASETSDLLVSYFLPAGTITGESWNRLTNAATTRTVQPSPEVRQMLDVPLYILVSGRTASAAEAVAYTLQQAERAVIVGSRTKGMANSGQYSVLDDEFVVLVPTTVNRNAVTGTNWEGTGVIPDIEIDPRKALDAAMAAALGLLADGQSADKTSREKLRFAAEVYNRRLQPLTPPDSFLIQCCGQYEQNTNIENLEGSLWFVQGQTRRRMQYLQDNTFTVEGRPDYRLSFPIDSGRVDQCEVLWFDNTSETRRRVR